MEVLLNTAGEQKSFLKWGEPRGGIVEVDPVPAGKMWIVRAAGLFTNEYLPQGADYMMEIVLPNTWRIPLEKSPRPVSTTPLLALSRQIVLLEGERLAGRTNGDAKFGINGLYCELDIGE